MNKRVYVFNGTDVKGRQTVGCSYEQNFPSEKQYVATEDAVQAVMDLFFALRSIKGQARPRDLVKLAKRIRGK